MVPAVEPAKAQKGIVEGRRAARGKPFSLPDVSQARI